MKLELRHGGRSMCVGLGLDFDLAMEWAENHGAAHDWSDEYDYILTDDNGKVYVIALGAWFEMV